MSQSQPFAGQVRTNGSGMPTIDLPTGTNGSPGGPTNGSMNGHGHAPVPVPGPHGQAVNGANDPMRGNTIPPNGHRSPPNQKNLTHVPCKFFKSGQCQAGKTCPFFHGTVQIPCKYFQKGNCKFGLRCANDHITTDGRRINKPAHLQQMNPQFNMGQRMMPQTMITGATMMAGMPQDPYMQQSGMPQFGQIPDELLNSPWPPRQPQDIPNIPTIDTTASSIPNSAVGSPHNDVNFLGKSPAVKGLSVLEAPLPASFDSQGISVFARTGPIAASMPARFEFENSPPSSSVFPGSSRPIESSTIRNLRSTAYDEPRNGLLMGSSPTVNIDDSIGRRIMHSERYSSRPGRLSSSVGARRPLVDVKDDDWDPDFVFEEDLLPPTLNDLLTPQERLRRSSRTQDDDNLFSHRAALSGLGTPNEAASPKVGSPLGASPSRFGPLFTRQQRERALTTETVGTPVENAFGHVGSPLRPSTLNPGSSPSMRPVSGSGFGVVGSPGGSSSRPTSGDFSMSSPPRNSSIGIISQQLQRARLSSRASDTSIDGNVSAGLRSAAQTITNPSSTIAVPPRLADRSVSTASSTGLGVGRDRIDEEPGVFSMDHDEEDPSKWKRISGGAAGLSSLSGSLGSKKTIGQK